MQQNALHSAHVGMQDIPILAVGQLQFQMQLQLETLFDIRDAEDSRYQRYACPKDAGQHTCQNLKRKLEELLCCTLAAKCLELLRHT